MEVITQIELAQYENVDSPQIVESNFRYSFSLLPRDERNAINSVYAFCSYIDDIVDYPDTSKDAQDIKTKRLLFWDQVIENIYSGKEKNELLEPLINLIFKYGIPKQYFITLIDGCRRDLVQNRYKNIEELKDYCYSVASVVGLISIEIFGYKYEETKNYAINLGYALQLTNIMRDVKADKDRGYIYLPLDDLKRFNYSVNDLISEVYDERFIGLMSFQAQRVREYFHKARQALHPDERVTLFAAEVMDAIYYRLLEKIELNDFNIFKEKITVSPIHKVLITLKHWLSIRMFISRIKKKL
jgi:phytoene synthase